MRKCFIRSFLATLLVITTFICLHAETPYQKIDLGYGKWSKSWYADDFDDPIYDMPYIQTELKTIRSKYSWRFFYIRYSNIPEIGDIFEMNIGADGSNISVWGSEATIKIKNSYGNISTINARVADGSIYIIGNEVLAFGNLINAGNYSMAVTFHSYLDYGGKPETWTFKCIDETKDFWKAVECVYE